ncbi:MAG: GntR family transcriptional regulator [Eubacteriales bacterium]|nr:GntR family transcriptional regulator [Eubacteriales bacterium]
MKLKKTLAEQIHQILRDDILSQRIKPGEKLTLKILQERFEVSSTPIREALTRLSEEGLTFYYSNIGVSVVELEENDIKEIFSFMSDLDGLAIRYCLESGEIDKINKELKENLEDSKSCIGNIQRWNELSDLFHLIFYKYCNNRHLISAAQKMRSQLSILSYQYQKDSQTQENILKEHEAIYDAFVKADYTNAAQLMREHLLHSMEYALNL